MSHGDSGSVLGPGALTALHLGTAGATGQSFFDQLVRHLAGALAMKYAWVTEYLENPERLRALSFWAGDRYVEDYEYALSGTPCELVVDRCQLIVVPDRVVELFPDDPDLEPLGSVSYMGVPLLDPGGALLGHLAVLHDEPLEDTAEARAVFEIFGARAAAELARERRDRALREQEAHLSGLIDSALDAILELDDALRVTRDNPAARRLFSLDRPPESIRTCFTPASFERLKAQADGLRRPDCAEASVWIPEGFLGRRSDGSTFPVEATLSRFEIEGRLHFTLIVRSVDERIRAEERIRALAAEAAYLRSEAEGISGFDEIIGQSPAMRALLNDLERVAPTDATVLITGDTGTGKELVARALHRLSPRRDRPLVRVNCAAIPASLQESEFFGHEKGAFTGAVQRREGRFSRADGGTIFLDEVGEMPLDLQAKLLRVLQEGEFEPVGSTHTESVDVRVVAATHRDLRREVEEGRFREDLLYRLNVIPLHTPALRERGEDVILLAEAFLERRAPALGRAGIRLTPGDRARLRSYDWPGNVRELENVLERALITSRDPRVLDLQRALPGPAAPSPRTSSGGAGEELDTEDTTVAVRILTETEMEALERENVARALEASGGKVSGPGGAAELLGVHPNTLTSRLRRMGISTASVSRSLGKSHSETS